MRHSTIAFRSSALDCGAHPVVGHYRGHGVGVRVKVEKIIWVKVRVYVSARVRSRVGVRVRVGIRMRNGECTQP